MCVHWLTCVVIWYDTTLIDHDFEVQGLKCSIYGVNSLELINYEHEGTFRLVLIKNTWSFWF
jgi:hypothetical protein